MSLKEEQEANAFAMELLMPEELFIEAAKEIHGKIYAPDNICSFHSVKGVLLTKEEFFIHKLARKCQVSEDMVKTRMINLGILTSA